MKAAGNKRAPGTRTRTARKSNGESASLASPPDPTSPTTQPNDAVAALAHQLYMERGGTHGHDVDDWLEAERRLRSRHA